MALVARSSGPQRGCSSARGTTTAESTQVGLTLVEMLIAGVVFVVGLLTFFEAQFSAVPLREHARNLSWATNDATRVVEQLRDQNSGAGCAVPDARPLGGGTWDAWLGAAGGGKSIQPAANERIMVTCQEEGDQDGDGILWEYCGTGQITNGVNGEWASVGIATSYPLVRLTVAVCWRNRGRVIGECQWNGAQLVANDNGDRVLTSPGMSSTVLACR